MGRKACKERREREEREKVVRGFLVKGRGEKRERIIIEREEEKESRERNRRLQR